MYKRQDWNHPGKSGEELLIAVRSRVSAVFLQVFNHKEDRAQNVLEWFLIAGFGIFVVVEIVSVVIGIGMTRTITGAVHRLYGGTQRVIAGNYPLGIGGDLIVAIDGEPVTNADALQRCLLYTSGPDRPSARSPR